MAKLPALVTALSEVDGRDRKTVDHIARTIRERGYITTGKRGGGAVDMTAHEAANLLIALNGADAPKDGPTAIDRFRSLRQQFFGTAKDIRERIDSYDRHIKPIQDVMDVDTFGEAFDSLIEDVPELVAALRSYVHNAYNDIDPAVLDDRLFIMMLRARIFGVEITFERYGAEIALFTPTGEPAGNRRVEFETRFVQDEDRIESGFYGKQWPDRRISVTIGTPTLIAAWQALHPGESLPGIPDLAPTPDNSEDGE